MKPFLAIFFCFALSAGIPVQGQPASAQPVAADTGGFYTTAFQTGTMTDAMRTSAVASLASLPPQTAAALSPDDVKARTTVVLGTDDAAYAKAWDASLPTTDNSRTKRVWHDTYGVQATLTVYYVDGDRLPASDHTDSIRITDMEGNLQIFDPTITVQMNPNHVLSYSCFDHHPATWGQSVTTQIPSVPFALPVAQDWVAADTSQECLGSVGVVWQIPLRRGDTEWTLTVAQPLREPANLPLLAWSPLA